MSVAGPRLPWNRLPAVAALSLFGRLRLMLALLFGLGTTAALVLGWAFSAKAANEAYDRLLVSAAVQIAGTLDVTDRGVTVAPPVSAFETLALAEGDRMFYSVWDPSGHLLTGDAPLRPATVRRADLGEPKVSRTKAFGDTVRTITLHRYISGSNLRGWSAIVVGQTEEARLRLTWRLFVRTAALVIVVSTLGYFTTLAATRVVLRPLVRIETALALREPNDVSPLNVVSPRETQALVDTINGVMARLAARMQKLERFAAVAAHQIRTPIAALAAQVELLDRHDEEAERAARIQRVRERVDELGRLTNQILGHAMLVYRAELLDGVPVDLGTIVRQASDTALSHSLALDLSVGFDLPVQPLWVRADPVSLREAVVNVIHNAIRHGARSRLDISVAQRDGMAVICVVDDGPGIDPDRWHDVVQPFRTGSDLTGGAGLGLSIVDEVVRGHGGEIVFAQSEGGFEVCLRFPVSREA